MDITVVLTLALVVFAMYLFLSREDTELTNKSEAGRLENEKKRVEIQIMKNSETIRLKEYDNNVVYNRAVQALNLDTMRIQNELLKNRAILERIQLLNNHELSLLTLQQEKQMRLLEIDLRRYQIYSDFRIKELEQRNVMIGHYVLHVQNQSWNKQQEVLAKINALKTSAEAQIHLLKTLDSIKAERLKNQILYDIDNTLNSINNDLNSPWG